MPRRLVVILSFLFFSLPAISQTSATAVPASDPQALTLAAAAVTALTNGQQISDATLQVTATDAVANVTGAAVLQAKGFGKSRIILQASNRTEIRGYDTAGDFGGSWMGADGITHSAASHNAQSDAAWFFPALSFALNAAALPNVVAHYVGQETRNGSSVQHIQLQRNSKIANPLLANLQVRLSTIDFYLDANSSLPVAETFKIHPDNDALTDIAIEVRFSNYQTLNGVLVPCRVQKFLNGGLVLDLVVGSVALNTGLSDSSFGLPTGQ